MLVRGGHVGGQPRLGLDRVRQGEVGGKLRLGTQVEVPAGGSMGMLRPLKRSTWKRNARPSRGGASDSQGSPAPWLPIRGKNWANRCFSPLPKGLKKENRSVNADYMEKC